MRKGSITAGLAAGVFGLSLVLGAGQPLADTDKPKYGGTLEVGTVYVTLTALSWDCADWNWKHNHDTGQFYEQLFAADLSKSVKNGGKHPFYADAWLPSDAIRGELAESWEWKENPLRIEIKLRKGIMFPEKPGVMAAREFVADDVVFSYNRLANSPRKIKDYFDHVAKVEATDKHTVVFTFKATSPSGTTASARATTRASIPRRWPTPAPANWKNVNGTGPVHAERFRAGQLQHLRQEPHLLGQGQDQRRRVQAALRRQARLSHHQGRGDLHHRAAHRQARHAREHSLAERRGAEEERAAAASGRSGSACRARSWRCTSTPSRSTTSACAARSTWPSTRRRSSRAYYNGNAELFAYPMHPDYKGYFEPLEAMPASVKELFEYNPDKAKKLLAEAGHPNGFSFKVQVCACNPDHMDLLPLVAAYLEKVGVKIEIQPMEYAAFLSAMTTRKITRRLLHEQRPHQPDHHHPQELHQGPAVEPSGWTRSRLRQEDGRGLCRARRGQAPGHAQGDDARDPRQGALHLAADALHLSRRGGRG